MAISPRRRETVTFRDAPLIYKNFAGEKRLYNNAGDRNFSIMMDEETAMKLQAQKSRFGDTWNIKPMKMREEDEEQLYHLKVTVAFGNMPPRCWLVTSGGRTLLGENMIGMFDKLQSIRVDLVIAAHDWEMNNGANTGRKAYLQSIFYHMYEDELELEYAEMPQLPAAGENGPRELEPGSLMAYDYEGEEV